MNSREVAKVLGTTPKILRSFLRSPSSTFRAVGSGARYEFTASDLPTLRKKFAEWNGAVWWFEEGPVVLEDLTDPDVRAKVRRIAAEQEARLELRLLAAGLHITQR